MKWEDIPSRLKGLQILGFGGNWEIPESHRTIARRLISFLEDRRVLYADWQPEVSNHCERVKSSFDFSLQRGFVLQSGTANNMILA